MSDAVVPHQAERSAAQAAVGASWPRRALDSDISLQDRLVSRRHATITAADFQPAYLTIAVIAACGFFIFARLPADAGAELARRTTAPAAGPTEATDQRMG